MNYKVFQLLKSNKHLLGNLNSLSTSKVETLRNSSTSTGFILSEMISDFYFFFKKIFEMVTENTLLKVQSFPNKT